MSKMLFRYFINSNKLWMRRLGITSEFPPDAFCTTGDSGFTRTTAGSKLPKDDKVFEAIGAAEELLSFLGLAREYAKESEHEYSDKIKRVQTVIIEISSAISKQSKENSGITARHIKELEDWINQYSKELPVPEKYIIPGSGVTSSTLHVARAVCRRAERNVTSLVRNKKLCMEAQIYLNRLSDFLFTVSRIAAKLDKRNESIYVPTSDNSSSPRKKTF